MKIAHPFLVLSAVLLSSQLSAKSPVIYGKDHRIEVYEASEAHQKLAASTASMIPITNITKHPTSSVMVQLKQSSLKEWLETQLQAPPEPIVEDTEEAITNPFKMNAEVVKAASEGLTFCAEERFVHQPNPSMCSGFLIAPDLIVTAGHCLVGENACTDNSWVFDFNVDKKSLSAGVEVNPENIYKCKRIVSGALNMDLELDYGVVQLDRPVKGRAPLELRKDGVIEDGSPLIVIGHPSGLPAKVAGGANVRTNTHPFHFSGNLDSFQGNSGSAVFNAATGLVEGILVRGENDFVPNKEKMCIESNRCEDGGCRGEDISRINSIPEVAVYTVFTEAASSGDLETIKEVLKVGIWIDFYLKDGQSALMKASANSQSQVMKFLIERGASVGLTDNQGNRAIHHLARKLTNASEDALKVLIAAKTRLEAKNANGDTALHVAANHLNLEGVKLLLKAGAKKNRLNKLGETVLFAFARKGDVESFKELVKCGIDPLLKNQKGYSALGILERLK